MLIDRKDMTRGLDEYQYKGQPLSEIEREYRSVVPV